MDEQLALLVEHWSGGDETALDRLVALLYEDLRGLAHAHLRRERSTHTLTTTALVNEAYLQLAGRTGPAWQGRAKFFALVSRVMRHVLVDYARRRGADKRGGGDLKIAVDGDMVPADAQVFEVVAVDQALARLAAKDSRLAQIVECRFFGGMSADEIAEALGVSSRTIERDWKRARAYLFTMLSAESRLEDDGK